MRCWWILISDLFRKPHFNMYTQTVDYGTLGTIPEVQLKMDSSPRTVFFVNLIPFVREKLM